MTKHHRKRGAIGLGMAVVALALAGCTLPGNVPLGSGPVLSDGSNSPSPSAVVERQARTRNVNFCIDNNTSMQMRISWRGYPSAVTIPPAGTQCNSGYEYWLYDVEGTLEYEPLDQPGEWRQIFVRGDNPWVSWPIAAAWFDVGDEHFGACGAYNMGLTHSFRIESLNADLTRNDDTDENVEFSLNLTPPSGSLYEPDSTTCVNNKKKSPL